MIEVDINSDVGESSTEEEFQVEECLLRYVTSANVSCGAHAGTPELIHRTLRECAMEEVGVGAHPSFPGRDGFGRRGIEMGSDELEAALLSQLLFLKEAALKESATIFHIKPHGALYNMAWKRRKDYAEVVTKVAQKYGLCVLAPAGSEMVRCAEERGVGYFLEGFADRNYMSDGTLVPRSSGQALVPSPDVAAERAVRLAEGSSISTVDGGRLEVRVDSICIHSDTPDACLMARRVKERLEEAGVRVLTLSKMRGAGGANR